MPAAIADVVKTIPRLKTGGVRAVVRKIVLWWIIDHT